MDHSVAVLHSAGLAVDAVEVPLRLRWQPRPWLVSVALVALVPAIALWATAMADSLGIMHLLTVLPVPATATNRLDRLLLLGTFLTVMLVFPLLAVLSGVLATISFDLRITEWEITASLRLPRPPWTLLQLVATALLLVGAILLVAMAGHLAADCVFGTDCMPG